MTVTFAQATPIDGSAGGALTGTFAGPCALGSLLAVAYTGFSTAVFRVDGTIKPALFEASGTLSGMGAQISLYRCAGGELAVTVTPSDAAEPWIGVITEVTGEALVRLYTETDATGIGDGATDFTFTPAPTDDPGATLMVAAVMETGTLTPGAGWTAMTTGQISDAAASTDATVAIAHKAYATTGTHAPETWVDPPGNGTDYWVFAVPLYQPGRRVGPAYAYAAAQPVQLNRPGHTEPPVATKPALPDLNPLPENPSPVVVPQPPWVPSPGRPYRRT